MVVHYKGVVLTNPMVVHYKGVVLTNPMAFHSVEEWYTHNPKSLSFFLQRCGSCLNKTFKTSLPCVIPLTCVTTPEPREVFTPLNDASSTWVPPLGHGRQTPPSHAAVSEWETSHYCHPLLSRGHPWEWQLFHMSVTDSASPRKVTLTPQRLGFWIQRMTWRLLLYSCLDSPEIETKDDTTTRSGMILLF